MALIDYLGAYASNFIEKTKNFFSKEKPFPEIFQQVESGTVADISALIEKGADVNATVLFQGEPVTPLHLARIYRKSEMAKILMQNGAIDSHDLKVLGHALGLGGRIKISLNPNNLPIDYEGDELKSTIPAINEQVSLFNRAVQHQLKSPHVSENFNDVAKKAMQIVTDTFEEFASAIETARYTNQAARYHKGLPVLFPCDWPGHSGVGVLYRDKLYIVNKGGNTIVPSVSCYQINALNLLGISKFELAALLKLLQKERAWLFSRNLALKEFSYLAPKLLYARRLKRQKYATCAYSNIKRGVETVLQALSDGNAFVDHEKAVAWPKVPALEKTQVQQLYDSFVSYDRFSRIDQYIEKYQGSPNKKVWEPLLKYLREKAPLQHKYSRMLTPYILQKLKSAPILMSDQEIVRGIQKVDSGRSLLWDLYKLGVYLENTLFQSTNRTEHANSILTTLPYLQTHQRYQSLKTAGMDTEALKLLYPKKRLRVL